MKILAYDKKLKKEFIVTDIHAVAGSYPDNAEAGDIFQVSGLVESNVVKKLDIKNITLHIV